MEIAGRTVVITGAAAGIGRAAALAFAARGAGRLVFADVDVAGMEQTAAMIARNPGGNGPKVGADRLDLSDIGALERWQAELAAEGGYDVLYNNAGVVSGAPQFPEASVEKLRWIIDVNLTSLIVATQTAAQHMRERGGGVIVNTVSTVALGKGFSDALYAATKGGVMLFTRSCASLKENWNVRVGGVLPGLTNTPILKKTGADGEYAPWMTPILAGNLACEPEDIADAVIDVVEDDSLPGGDWVAVRKIDGVIQREWGHDEGA